WRRRRRNPAAPDGWRRDRRRGASDRRSRAGAGGTTDTTLRTRRPVRRRWGSGPRRDSSSVGTALQFESGQRRGNPLLYLARSMPTVDTIQIPNRSLFRQPEVCEIARLQPYVLRSWEAEFPDL